MIKIYGDSASGNCYKVRLIAHMQKLTYQWRPVDILAGETQTPDFLALNPHGAIPLLQLEDGSCLSESNAILFHLANTIDSAASSQLWPENPSQQSRVLQWMFFEQYSHEPTIAVARFIARYLGLPDERREEFESKQVGGNKALSTMEQHLTAGSEWMGSDHFSIADIALFAYTHVADEGGFELSRYPAISQWLARVRQLPRFKSMQDFIDEDSIA